MNRDIQMLPLWARVLAFGLLTIGTSASWIFVGWYGCTRAWSSSAMGRHIIAFSSVVAAFFTLYLVLMIWPNLPGRSTIRFTLLICLVGVVVWRLVIFAVEDWRDRRPRDSRAPGTSASIGDEERN